MPNMHKEVKSMQKLVIGMIAVVCLDLGFAAFIATNDQGNGGTMVAASASIDRVSTSDSSNNVADSSVPENTISASSGSSEVSIVKRSSIYYDLTRPRQIVHRRNNVGASPLVVKNDLERSAKTYKVIVSDPYALRKSDNDRPGTEKPAKTSATSNLAASLQTAVVRKTDKKSFVASTLPFLRKPYDLIRVIGSKLF